jgi:chitin disaccharide deacetylase
MVGGPAAADAVARARRLPSLRVGLHVVLVEGSPLTDPSQIPDLLDAGGRLRNDLARYGAEIAMRPSLRRQAAKEIAAQFEAYESTGLPLDHVDAHRHFHLHPTVAGLILSIGRQYGMCALRVPVEPRHIIAGIDPRARQSASRITAPWAAWLRRRAQQAGLTTADAVFGFAWSGAMTAPRLAALVGRLPAGVVEIYLHPAVTDAFPGAAAGYRYAEEFAALCDSACVAAVRRSSHALGGYGNARG